ncbi:DUF4424 domain-containing protein [Kumtagia ephedrae]|uniref:DUF4424 domain-containing protein n=1 Tax=Kumtagia ephedrae TaxID=2116701 RepID=A0A2P7RR31_9HYPH|nr:DUF4424 domain-containing protein [Mesorhizobium ephedrae]PSJ52674.1 hypothetical protein C7I84_26170 [Mesorhizobium ephedrae]
MFRPLVPGIVLAGLLSGAAPALANDSTAELGTGGLILARTDAIAMQKEELFISEEIVRVDYVFRNETDADVDTIVAFPMPDIDGNPYTMPAIPNDADANFLGFEVSVDGKPVEAALQQRAFAAGIDVTQELVAQGVPLYPNGDAASGALAKIPDAVAADWIDRGIIVVEEYDDGSGWKKVRSPFWRLQSVYWWRSRFPANADVRVSHRYKPSVGSTVGLSFLTGGKPGGEVYEDYKAKYCIDAAFERAVAKAAAAAKDGEPALYENRIEYVLTTGGNWANGTIGDFRLTVDKGDPTALISFCGSGVRKTGPTTFEMSAKDFYPQRDIDILLLKRWPGESGEPAAARTGSGG